ncbi:large ribosomal subunit protein bL32m-like [Saccostrea echinata]|uniref:large ribosomal subunit protein bL32m-like n=1 Tax=Saccostrea echinata TaxID=191078 RepID=UPI002A804B48|nr:large ribosomal subunit protein bL32m-like [Saccostrea echinata]
MSLITKFQRTLQNLYLGFRYNAPALVTVNHLPEKYENGSSWQTLKDCFENIMRAAVPKKRRSKEKRMMRKMGHYGLFLKENFKERREICLTCGNYFRRGFLCDHCYNTAKQQTMKIWKEIGDKYMNFQYFTVDDNPNNVRRSFRYEKLKDWFPEEQMEKSSQTEKKESSESSTHTLKETTPNS